MVDTGILVVTYNQYDITRNFILNFLEYFSHEKYYLLVLDNNSLDMSFEKLKNEFDFIDIRKLNDNYGCVTGRNIGIVELIKLGVNYIYISDNDIRFNDKELFEKLKNFIEIHSEIDACCPVVKWSQDKKIQSLGAKITRFGRFINLDTIGENRIINILPGCAQFLKAETFKKYGLFDNDLTPFSIEDLEWGLRATKNGAKFEYCPDVEVFHLHEKNKKLSSEMMRYIINGRMVFLRKYFGLYNLLREIKHFIICIKNYGFVFTVQKYLDGYKKKTNINNYDFKVFGKELNKFYIKNSTTEGV